MDNYIEKKPNKNIFFLTKLNERFIHSVNKTVRPFVKYHFSNANNS